jgi:hypothetical protein
MNYFQRAKFNIVQFTGNLAAQATGIGYLARLAHADMKEALNQIDTVKAVKTLNGHSHNAEAAQRVYNDLDIHAKLLFFCGPKIAAKISDFKDKDGHTLVQDQGDHITVWQSGAKKEEELQKILVAIDPDKKTQICATYDIANKDLVVHFGGTDFSNSKDLAFATTSLTGALNPRSSDGAVYAQKIMTSFSAQHPDTKPEDVNLSIVAHSSGAASTPAAIMAFAEQGFAANKVFLLDPCGGKAAYDATSALTGIDPALLSQNTTTIRPQKKGLLEHFKQATASIGTDERHDIGGHMGRHFVQAFHNKKFE